jgi:hypothetical protein
MIYCIVCRVRVRVRVRVKDYVQVSHPRSVLPLDFFSL